MLASVLKGHDVTEIYSPERVTKLCKKYGLVAGDSYDLRDGYDLSDERVQALVISRIQKTKPTIVVGSPPCTMFSRLQQLNLHVLGQEWADKFYVEREKSKQHIVFCLKVFQLQRVRGAYFLMEHPDTASSWDIQEMTDFAKTEGVMFSVGDQCVYGLETRTID